MQDWFYLTNYVVPYIPVALSRNLFFILKMFYMFSHKVPRYSVSLNFSFLVICVKIHKIWSQCSMWSSIIIFMMEGMEHYVYVKILAVYSLQPTEMLLLISQMLRNGQVHFSPTLMHLFTSLPPCFYDVFLDVKLNVLS